MIWVHILLSSCLPFVCIVLRPVCYICVLCFLDCLLSFRLLSFHLISLLSINEILLDIFFLSSNKNSLEFWPIYCLKFKQTQQTKHTYKTLKEIDNKISYIKHTMTNYLSKAGWLISLFIKFVIVYINLCQEAK